ncbi:MAG: acylphosphatase [Spirochaetia bacterium]|nr:acylphosphatase [Spirochaetia bacterium]
MAIQLILTGKVQGVFCRDFCQKNAQALNIKGSASNLADGSVSVLLNTNDEKLISEYIRNLKENPKGFRFFGEIIDIEKKEYNGSFGGDYNF